MGRELGTDGGGNHFEKAAILGDLRQRRILSMLLDRSRPTTARDISDQVATREAGSTPTDVTAEERRRVQVDLRHRCLPKLEAVGWIERQPDGIVAEEPAFLDVDSLSLPELHDPEHPSWDAVSVLLARPRRTDLVSVVADQQSHITLEAVGAELRERGLASRRGWPADDRSLLCTLHHVDLPKLAETGVVEYDVDERTVARTPRLMSLVDRTGIHPK